MEKLTVRQRGLLIALRDRIIHMYEESKGNFTWHDPDKFLTHEDKDILSNFLKNDFIKLSYKDSNSDRVHFILTEKGLKSLEDPNKVLAEFDGNSEANRRFRDALYGKDEYLDRSVLLERLGYLKVGLSEIETIYRTSLGNGNSLQQCGIDSVRLLVKDEIMKLEKMLLD